MGNDVFPAVTEECRPREKVKLLMNVVHRCSCTDDYRGLNCSEPNFCSVYSCPSPAQCRNLEFGYECKYCCWQSYIFTVFAGNTFFCKLLDLSGSGIMAGTKRGGAAPPLNFGLAENC